MTYIIAPIYTSNTYERKVSILSVKKLTCIHTMLRDEVTLGQIANTIFFTFTNVTNHCEGRLSMNWLYYCNHARLKLFIIKTVGMGSLHKLADGLILMHDDS